MPVVQVAFDVPPSVALGLSKGALELCGGVVRNAKNKQVVMWLREADIVNPDDVRGAGRAVAQVVENGGIAERLQNVVRAAGNNKPIVIGAAIAAGVAVAAGGVYRFVSRKRGKAESVEISSQAIALDEAIGAYTAAVNSGEMSVELIDNLINALNVVDDDAEIKLSAKDLKRFVSSVREYTKRLCSANKVSTKGLSSGTRKKDADSLIVCLEFQKKVFEQAA